MKFLVGYQLCEDKSFLNGIIQHKDSIHEVYFSWGDFANGRHNQLQNETLLPWQAQEAQISDLKIISSNKIPLNLLLNGNCYGSESQSRFLFNKIGDTIDYLLSHFNLNSVTTTSPLIAKFIKENFEKLDVRASVNMRIGTVDGMDYLAELFDSFYMQRDYNRDIKKIIALKEWCDKSDKKLFALANSGCLNYCSAQTFHDNLVSHESEISKMDNAYEFKGQCWEYLSRRDHQKKWIRQTNFIRPEDVKHYDGLFAGMKLATRVNPRPLNILSAYIKGHYIGGISDILEPAHSSLFYPAIIENSRIPNDFAEKTLTCGKQCLNCGYCEAVYNSARVELDGGVTC